METLAKEIKKIVDTIIDIQNPEISQLLFQEVLRVQLLSNGAVSRSDN